MIDLVEMLATTDSGTTNVVIIIAAVVGILCGIIYIVRR